MRNNDFKREELRNFIVRVEYQNDEDITNASGVIIKTKSSYYILTVKHTFKERENQPLSEVKLVNFDLINVYTYNKEKIPINEVIYLDNKELDISLLKIDVNRFKKIEKIKSLELYMGEFNYCAIAGYPESREDNQSVIIQVSNPDEIEEDFYSLQLKAESQITSYHKDEMETLQGLSGGGVFIRGGSGKIYLIGIQYAYTDYTVFLKILDIRTIINDIESKIDEEIQLGKYPFFEKLGIDASKVNFEALESIFRNNKDIQKIKNNSNEYKFLLEDNKQNRKLEKSYISLKKQMKNLAFIYFYQGKIFFENNDKIRAYNAFTRAMELYPAFKKYFLRDDFKEEYLTDKQKEESKNTKENSQIFSDSEISKILLEENINNNIQNNKSDSLEKNIEELISFLYSNFNENKQEIINWLIKLSKVKLYNRKHVEAEKILLNVRDNLDNGERRYHINVLLKDIYYQLINYKNTSISYHELRLKLEKLLIYFENKEDVYLSITTMIQSISTIKYYDNDCFIEHLESQRKKIEKLKNENYKLILENEECFNKISYEPIFLKESIKQENIKKIWNIYCKTRFVILSIILITPIVLWIVLNT
ncbi:MAG TPA: hypothetical protein ENK66_02530 [Arcobacter sp.]|nr:hypothetical protein [Arcobacter sp.]